MVTPARPASSRSPKPARFTVARSVAASASAGSASRAPAACTSASRATFRPSSERNHVLIPVAVAISACGTPRRSRARIRQRRSSDGARKRRSTIGAAVRWAWRVDSQASPRSSIQRIGASSGSSASGSTPRTAREVLDGAGPRGILGERAGAGLLEARGAPC